MRKVTINDSHNGRTLVISDPGNGEHFEERMILSLDHPSLLRPLPDGYLCDGSFRYDISGLESLSEDCKKRNYGTEEVTAIVLRLGETVRYLEDHMLCDGNILLDPDHIYLDGERLRFVPVKSSGDCFSERILSLGNFLFVHSDPESEDTMRLVNGLERMILAGNCHMHDLLRVCEKRKIKAADLKPCVIIPEKSVTPELPPDQNLQKKLPVFEKELRTDPSEVRGDGGGEARFMQFLEEKNDREEKNRGSRILRRTLLAAAAEVLLCDAVFFFLGRSVFMKILPAAVILFLVTVLYGLFSLLSEKHKNVETIRHPHS